MISNLGRVKSLARSIVYSNGRIHTINETIIKHIICKGYPSVRLCKNGKHYNKRIHRLLAIAFINNPLGLPEINHENGNKLCFALDNITWSTRKYNQQHAYDTGLQEKGEKHGMAKIPNSDVKKIKELKGLMFQKDIAKMFNIHQTTVSLILNNKSRIMY